MKTDLRKFLLAGLHVALLLLIYNLAVSYVFDFWPDVTDREGGFLGNFWLFGFYVFGKGFFAGFVMSLFFRQAMRAINEDDGGLWNQFKAPLLFSTYGIFALMFFTITDLRLYGNDQGLLLLLTVDSLVETGIATVPIRFFLQS